MHKRIVIPGDGYIGGDEPTGEGKPMVGITTTANYDCYISQPKTNIQTTEQT